MLGSFEGRSNFTTWLTRIAANCALDQLRSRRRRDAALTPALEGAGRRWAISAAAILLLTVGFLAGRRWQPIGRSPVPSLAADEGDRILLAAVAEHLQRSEMLILEYVHSHRGPDSARRAQVWAEALVAANRLYRQVALAHREQAMTSMLDELEPVLVEIEHSSDDQPGESLAQRIQSKDVLFKIRVVESQIEQRRITTTQTSWKL
jgi:DNA-directed RNA polymerase specialized sigma24 family protein